MSGITEHCLHRSAQEKVCFTCNIDGSEWLHFHLCRLGSLCFQHVPSEVSSANTFITLGRCDEEFSIRSGSNKSSLTGGGNGTMEELKTERRLT